MSTARVRPAPCSSRMQPSDLFQDVAPLVTRGHEALTLSRGSALFLFIVVQIGA